MGIQKLGTNARQIAGEDKFVITVVSLRTALYVLYHGLYGFIVAFNRKHRHALIKFKATNQMFIKCNNVFTGQ